MPDAVLTCSSELRHGMKAPYAICHQLICSQRFCYELEVHQRLRSAPDSQTWLLRYLYVISVPQINVSSGVASVVKEYPGCCRLKRLASLLFCQPAKSLIAASVNRGNRRAVLKDARYWLQPSRFATRVFGAYRVQVAWSGDPAAPVECHLRAANKLLQ